MAYRIQAAENAGAAVEYRTAGATRMSCHEAQSLSGPQKASLTRYRANKRHAPDLSSFP